MDHKSSFFKKADIALAIALLLLGGAVFALLQSGREAGAFAVVTVDGTEWGVYPLSEDRAIDIETPFGRNVLRIEGGAARIEDADCPNRDCVEKGRISQTNQIILCLPHKLAVTIRSEADSGKEAPDAVSY